MTLLGACADWEPRRPRRAYANTTEAHTQGFKDRRAAHLGTATPPTANRRPRSGPTRGTAPAGRGQAKVLSTAPRRRRREAAGLRAAPRTGRHDRSDRHRHLQTKPHPRSGESAVQVSSQSAIPANEFPTLKIAAQQMPSRDSAHKADYAPRTDGELAWSGGT